MRRYIMALAGVCIWGAASHAGELSWTRSDRITATQLTACTTVFDAGVAACSGANNASCLEYTAHGLNSASRLVALLFIAHNADATGDHPIISEGTQMGLRVITSGDSALIERVLVACNAAIGE